MRSKITAAVDEYIAAHAGSMSQREIADACGLAPSTVSRRLRALRAEGATVARPEGKPVERNARGDGEDDDPVRVAQAVPSLIELDGQEVVAREDGG